MQCPFWRWRSVAAYWLAQRGPATNISDEIIKKLTFVEPRASTALYDASYLALERVASGIHQKRAILIISDGQDNNSRYTFSQLRRALKESGVLIYAIGIEGPTPGDVLDFYGKMLVSPGG